MLLCGRTIQKTAAGLWLSVVLRETLLCRFTPPIDPAKSEGILTDMAVAQKVYQQVKDQVYSGIAQLQQEQRTDPKNGLPSRYNPLLPARSVQFSRGKSWGSTL